MKYPAECFLSIKKKNPAECFLEGRDLRVGRNSRHTPKGVRHENPSLPSFPIEPTEP